MSFELLFLLLILLIPLIFMVKKEKYKHVIQYLAYKLNCLSIDYIRKNRPKRIILLRHGETVANIDSKIYSTTPDNKIELTASGHDQAKNLGKKLKSIIKEESVIFYISTFTRCLQTFENIYKSFQFNRVKKIYDPRIREQEWGNYQHFSENPEDLDEILKKREEVGRMYYRFDHGESGCDVYIRVSSFMESMFRYMDHIVKDKYENIIIVTHGLTMRYFIMRFLKLSVEEFEKMWNPLNCEFWILENRGDGYFQLITEIQGFKHLTEGLVPMSATFK